MVSHMQNTIQNYFESSYFESTTHISNHILAISNLIWASTFSTSLHKNYTFYKKRALRICYGMPKITPTNDMFY